MGQNGNGIISIPLGVNLKLFLNILKAIKGFLEIALTVQARDIYNNWNISNFFSLYFLSNGCACYFEFF